MTVKLAQLHKNGILIPFPEAISAFQQLTEVFTNTPVITLTSPNELAQRMAKIARLIRGRYCRYFSRFREKNPSRRSGSSFL